MTLSRLHGPITRRLFVYGTLGPGRANEEVVGRIGGEWLPASVRGRLVLEGWAAEEGYPGMVLDEEGEEVAGLLFVSEALPEHWGRLDAFEGEDFQRVATTARLEDGTRVDAFVYVLRTELSAGR